MLLSGMGLCNELYDKMPDENFLHDLDRLHTWKPTPIKIEIMRCYDKITCDTLRAAHL